MVHLYGIVEPDVRCSGEGLHGAPLLRVVCGDVAAIVSEHAESLDADPTEDALWVHEGVLEVLLEAGPVLPVRFGVRFADLQAVRATVQPRGSELANVLGYVRGRVEVGVRLLARDEAREPGAEDAVGVAGPGARYLSERLLERREASRRLETVQMRLRPLAIAEQSRLLPRPGSLAAAAFLVERSRLELFREEAQALGHELRDVALVCTGPWPAYNFVGEPLRETA
jgi:Gas vesicle synthesis protein GvpL/GvpF